MSKQKCNNCGNSYEKERTNQIYCSDTCKSQAYQKRKEQKESEALANKDLSTTKKQFSISTHEKIVELGCKSNSFLEFCFVTQNLADNIPVEKIAKFHEKYEWDFEQTIWTQKYPEFCETFHEKCEVVE